MGFKEFYNKTQLNEDNNQSPEYKYLMDISRTAKRQYLFNYAITDNHITTMLDWDEDLDEVLDVESTSLNELKDEIRREYRVTFNIVGNSIDFDFSRVPIERLQQTSRYSWVIVDTLKGIRSIIDEPTDNDDEYYEI